MWFEVISFLLDVAVTLVGGACLLRLYMRWRGMPLGNPLGRFVQALSDWLVRPLHKIMPPAGRVDIACVLAAWLLKLLQYGVLLWMLGAGRWALLPVLALLGVLKLALSVATALIIVAVVLSWVQNRTAVAGLLEQLTAPLLAPVRRVVPLVGGVDLSPLLAVVGLQVLGIMLGQLQAQWLGHVVMAVAR